MLKAVLTSTGISKLLFAVLYIRKQRKDSLPSAMSMVVVQVRYVRT